LPLDKIPRDRLIANAERPPRSRLSQGDRSLSAVMFTDMVGFTALTQSDEAQSLAVLERHNKLLRPIFSKYRGREVKTIGDSFLVEFDSALDATNCAVEVQRFLHDYNISSRDEWKIALRIGVHLGDVVRSGDDILGDAVNIASRLQPLAEPEGVCISEQVYDQVRNKIPEALVKLEPHDLKGVRFAVDAYKVVMPWNHGTAPSRTQADRNRVAVLPFANMSPDPNDEYFADGMTEELIDRLAQVKGLEVIARTSVMSYKKKEKNVLEIARELEAGSVVEGSVRKAGNRVRVTAQLINGATQGHVWSSHYDGSLDDIFAVQSEIAEKVAGELKVQLLQSEKKALEKKPTQNMEAYSEFLRGRELLREGSEPSLRQALEIFERAVELDPSFARAFEGQAECLVTLANDGYEPYQETNARGEHLAKRSLELDPDLAEAHATLAYVYFGEDRVISCEVEAKRALELNPNISDAYRELAFISFVRGNPNQGIVHLETAWRLDPLRSFYVERLGQMYYYMGRKNDALSFWEKTRQLAPAANYRSMTEYYVCEENYDKAKDCFELAKKLEPTHHWVSWMQPFIAARTGDKDGALISVRAIEENQVMSVDLLNTVAFIHYALDDFDSYFKYVNKATEQGSLRFIYVMYSPLFAKARDDPRYQAVLDAMKRNSERT
jgi:adenylate cyclase